MLSRERRWWTKKVCQAGVSACAKKRNWRHSTCGEVLRTGIKMQSQYGINRKVRPEKMRLEPDGEGHPFCRH